LLNIVTDAIDQGGQAPGLRFAPAKGTTPASCQTWSARETIQACKRAEVVAVQ
jgi:hypothetical protein